MRYRDQRSPAEAELSVIVGDDLQRCQLVNISPSGARLAYLDRLPCDTLVTLSYLHMRIPARVAWSNHELTGVRFLMPLSTTDMNALRRAGGRDRSGWGSSQGLAFRELS